MEEIGKVGHALACADAGSGKAIKALAGEVRRLRAQVKRLEAELAKAMTVIDN
jgi:hypothetical protein